MLRTVVETVSLVVLLVNLATAHLPAVTSAVGPLHGFAYEDIPALLYPFVRRTVLPTTAHTLARAWEIAIRYRFHIYDATLVASALSAGCDVLYTEDLQHGQTVEGLRIVNPFLA